MACLQIFCVVIHQNGAVYLDDALDARPTTVVGGKIMQRGGPDTAGAVFSDFLTDGHMSKTHLLQNA